MPKPHVQIAARLDLETAEQLEKLKAVHGTTVATLTTAIRELYQRTDTQHATSTDKRSNRRYGQTEQERETLARILELDNAGRRKGEIVKTLNAEQRKTRTGTDWTIQRLVPILNTAKGGNE